MDIEAVAFDVNGTLIDIVTEDDRIDIFRAAGHYLTYQGIELRRDEVRDLYFQTMKAQLKASPEKYPEFDAVAVWRQIVEDHATEYTRSLPQDIYNNMALFLAQIYRGISRRRLCLYPHVVDVLEVLKTQYKLALVTDAQSAFARGELHKAGLLPYFDPIIVSGDYGYRKPDVRLFRTALEVLGTSARTTVFVGNDMFHDIYGAQQAGLTAVMYNSNQGLKSYKDTVPDFTITDYRELPKILNVCRAMTPTVRDDPSK